LAATDSVQPFWFVANQHGKIQSKNSSLNISGLIIGQSYDNRAKSKLGYTWGSDFLAAFGNSNYYQINRAFAGIALTGWEIKAGLFYDEIKFAGLSTSNGNIARSINARPMPKIRLSTLEYKPVPHLQNWLSFKAEYDEGFLNDNRYVDGAHLHHKSLYFKVHTSSTWNFLIGFEHYAMWGGTSRAPDIGKLPEGWNAYWHYVFALPGGDGFPQNDRKNISGNQLGTYQLQFEKDLKDINIEIYLSHPWEDNSGLNWHNWKDNLLGLHVDLKNKNALITNIVYEFSNTRQQSIKNSVYTRNGSGQLQMKEYDNYFNNSIYRSGFTYRQQTLGSPLFYPVMVKNGISMGFQSNRFFSHHIGAKGNFSETIVWKGLLTYIQQLGTYPKPYTPDHKQVSGLFEVHYSAPGFPVELGISAGADATNISGNNLGVSFLIAKKW
jgi:hypothetical protein